MRIGIDIGGMSIKIGLVDENHEIINKKKVQTNAEKDTAKQIIKRIADAVLELLQESEMSIEDCDGLGVACPGTVDISTGQVLYSNNLKWANIPLQSTLSKYLAIPIAVANDADAAALGEVLTGSATGKENAILLTLGTGVGGGVIINHQIYNGPLRGGCEPGHMVIQRNGRTCTCGRKGCLEAYASARALMQSATEAAEKYPNSVLNRAREKNEKGIDGRLIFDAAKQGDTAAKMVVEDYEEWLSIGIANLINIFRPDIVILGGGVSAQKEYLTNALQQRVEKMCFGGNIGEIPQIVTSTLGNDAGMIGAAFLN